MESDQLTCKFVTAFRRAGVFGEPCDESTVRNLERQLGVSLPAAYRAFLIVAGHGFPAWTGSHHTVDDDLPALQQRAGRLVQGRGSKLPADSFAFLIHQGAAVQFFVLGDGDDPAVYEWVDRAEPQPMELVSQNFSAFLVESNRAGQ